jgi:predicted transposase YdaD
MLTTIIVYKFTYLTRREAEAMLGINLQETRFYQEAKEDGGREIVLRLLGRQCGELSQGWIDRVSALSLEQLEALGEALLDFESVADLESWLSDLQPQAEER